MRSSRLQKLIGIGPISGNVSLRVISDLAKFHAFIMKLNNSVFFLVDNSWASRDSRRSRWERSGLNRDNRLGKNLV